MTVLEHNTFLVELGRLFELNQSTGSVYVTLKRFYGAEHARKGKKRKRAIDEAGDKPTPVCLIRAYAKGKKKYSTVVKKEEHIKFQIALTNVLRANMDNLQRKAKKKASAAA